MGFHRISYFLVLALFTSLVFGEIVDSVVAKSKNTVFTYSEIVQEGQLLNIENRVPMETPFSKELKKKILDLLIIRDILFVEAVQEGITAEENEINKALRRYYKLKELKNYLKNFDITKQEFRIILKKRIIADKMTLGFLKKKFKKKEVGQEKKKKAVEEWYKFLRKRRTIILYSIP